MKILFDHGTPAPLRRNLAGHAVDTAASQGWERLSNGELLDQAENHGYQVLVTTDKSMRYQQNFSRRQIAVLVLLDFSWPEIQHRANAIRAAVENIQSGEIRQIAVLRE